MKIDDFRAIHNVSSMYAIGLADKLITIRSQQIRSICFADLLTGATPPDKRKNIAILGVVLQG